MPLAAGTRVGPYEIVELLGAGGMGEVYRARDARLHRDVALKVLPGILSEDPTRMQRFEREAHLLASLNHPNIATLHGVEESAGGRALVMELVEGVTLGDRIAAGPLALEDALACARQIADALEAAHDRGIIHRDLKPANIKVTPDGRVKVLDFGLAKALDDEPAHSSAANSPTLSIAATRVGMILGTAAYMSPEQAKGKSADRRADIWSFGVVVCEMLTGRQMYSGETAAETLANVITGEPSIPAGIPPAIHNLLRRCLEKDPRRRLQAIGEARLMLEEPASSSWAGAPAPPASRPALLRPILGAFALTLLALAALAYVHFREQPPPALTTRFQVPAPDKATVFDSPAISPDGRKLAFVATLDGKPLLWTRSLDSLDAQPLPGTDGAMYPFWSPDGRFLAFFAQGKLKKIDVAGGPPQTLCDAASPYRGGTWGGEGTILFAQGINTPLYRVRATGGIPAPVTTLDSKTEIGHRWPHFLPDGKHFLYVVTTQKTEDRGVVLGSLDEKPGSMERRRVLAGYTMSAWSAGHLLFASAGTLMAQPFDMANLRLEGEPFPIVQQIGVLEGLGGWAAFSASAGGTLAYRTRDDVKRQLTWVDRAGKEIGRLGAPDNQSGPRLSPDGKRVAVGRHKPQPDIWLLELARDAGTRFTVDPLADSLPVWSLDGRWVAFSSNRDGEFNLYRKPATGAGNEELLLKSADSKYLSDWSPDGRHLVYSIFRAKIGFDIWALPLEGDRKPFPVVQDEGTQSLGQFSPDGRWIAYHSSESSQLQVYVQAFPKSAGKFPVSTGGGDRPRWNRNGREMFYLSLDGKLMAVDVTTTATTFEAGRPRELFQTRAVTRAPYMHTYDVTADGQRFLINSNLEAEGVAPMTVVLNWAPKK